MKKFSLSAQNFSKRVKCHVRHFKAVFSIILLKRFGYNFVIGIDSSPCSLSLGNRSTLCSNTTCYQNKSDLKNVFVQKSFFFQYLLFFQSQSCLLESTAAIFWQSAGYVY